MNKAVLLAYDSYILAQKAKMESWHGCCVKEDILEILRVLQASYKKREGFYNEEIRYVYCCLFENISYSEAQFFLFYLSREERIIWTEGGWKLAPSADTK